MPKTKLTDEEVASNFGISTSDPHFDWARRIMDKRQGGVRVSLASDEILRVQADQGLTDATLLELLLDYIDGTEESERAVYYVIERASPEEDEEEEGGS